MTDTEKKSPLKPELLDLARRMADDEATDAALYRALAALAGPGRNREILASMADDEARHCAVWADCLDRPPRANMLKVRFCLLLSRIFGLAFVINLMEEGEAETLRRYALLEKELPVVRAIMEDETRHEEQMVAMLREERVTYISSMVLGLNDALVELTGALAGFTLALNNNVMIGLAGFITGVAATLSMASAQYLAQKAESGGKRPLKAALYTGCAYMLTVALLLAPYALTDSPLRALGLCLASAACVIAVFSYFVAVVRKQPFWPGFREMLCISFGVALVSFCIGWAARAWLHLDI